MEKKNLKRGLFITFEGPEGCGKSTHSKLLYAHLKRRGYPCFHTREPGGTKLGERIRKILLDGKRIGMNDTAELLLFEASRAQLVEEVIMPALKNREIVISDRFSDATLAYQGYGGGLRLNFIKEVDRVATQGCIKPDLTVLLDVDTKMGLKRATKKRVDRMELKGLQYHKRVRAGYLKLAREDPARIRLVRVKRRIDNTQDIIRREVELVIQRYRRAG